MYLNMKLKNMLQNDKCTAKVMKKKIKSLLVENDVTT